MTKRIERREKTEVEVGEASPMWTLHGALPLSLSMFRNLLLQHFQDHKFMFLIMIVNGHLHPTPDHNTRVGSTFAFSHHSTSQN